MAETTCTADTVDHAVSPRDVEAQTEKDAVHMRHELGVRLEQS
jgi:hypothetical protein